MCYLVVRGTPHCVPESHHMSGRKGGTGGYNGPMNVWVAHGVEAPPAADALGMTGLRVGGRRAIRARWPDGDPEYQLFPLGWYSPAKWAAPKRYTAAEDITVHLPNRSAEGPCSSGAPDTLQPCMRWFLTDHHELSALGLRRLVPDHTTA